MLDSTKIIQLIAAEQDSCENSDPETCDVCHAFNLLMEKIIDG